MWRYFVGAMAALVFAAGGLLWWRTTAIAERTGAHASLAAAAGEMISGNEAMPAPPTADEKTKEEKRFARYDKDRNGRVTRDEYLAARHKNFEKLDKNGDGVLSFEEYATKAEDKFTDADKDKNGSLNPEEFATTRVQRKSKPRPNCPPVQKEEKGEDDGN